MQLFKLAFTLATFGGLAQAVPGGVTSAIAPSQAAPAGCAPTYAGSFNIATVNVSTASSKRNVEKRQASGELTLTLDGGILHDQIGRTGYIASNFQFQFDGPPQAGAIYTAGWSVCGNGSLALGNTAIFYACYSGGFYNLYNTNWAPQCSAIYIEADPGSNSGQGGDGQPTAGSAVPSVTEKSEGQPGATSVASSAISEKSEGQPVATTVGSVVTEATDGQPALNPTAVSQISDGQPQAASPVTLSLTVVSEKSEGQPVASSPTISVSVSSAPVVSEKSEGQPVATSAASSAPVVSEKSEGQPVATSAASTASATASGAASSTSAPLAQTSAGAPHIGSNVIGLAAGVVGAMALL